MRPANWQLGPLVAGIGVMLFGVLELLDSKGTIDLTFAVIGPLALAVMGATLLAMGLTRRD